MFRTLLVEDNGPLRVLMRILLEQAKRFQIVGEATNGLDAIEKARRLQPDLVLLDLLMPVMSGTEALPRLRQVAPRTRIVVHSMLGERARQSSLDLGADAFVDKSLPEDELVNAILEAMTRTATAA